MDLLHTCSALWRLQIAPFNSETQSGGERHKKQVERDVVLLQEKQRKERIHETQTGRGERAFNWHFKLSHRRFLAMIWLYRWKEWFIINRWLEQILPVTRDVSRRETQRRRQRKQEREKEDGEVESTLTWSKSLQSFSFSCLQTRRAESVSYSTSKLLARPPLSLSLSLSHSLPAVLCAKLILTLQLCTTRNKVQCVDLVPTVRSTTASHKFNSSVHNFILFLFLFRFFLPSSSSSPRHLAVSVAIVLFVTFCAVTFVICSLNPQDRFFVSHANSLFPLSPSSFLPLSLSLSLSPLIHPCDFYIWWRTRHKRCLHCDSLWPKLRFQNVHIWSKSAERTFPLFASSRQLSPRVVSQLKPLHHKASSKSASSVWRIN